MEPAPHAPTGTIALLFTDIEGSTRLASELGSRWPDVLTAHHALIGGAIAAEGGFVDRTEGDAFFATFADAAAGARAAVAALRALRAHPWPAKVGELRVRMGLHVGYVERNATGYLGLEVHRAARVAAAAHGGQLLLTSAARALVGDAPAVEPLGAHRLKDFPAPEPLFCAVVDGRGAAAFPPPRAYEARPTNLPAGTPALIGREDELDRLRAALLVEGERLVTLTGRGGAGKTSLALVAAADLLDEHPGGVWLARLASLASADEVLPAVAVAVGAEGEAARAPLDAIAGRLRNRGPVLLVLDNFEHLAPAAPSVAALLEALPELRVLVTSQAPLRVAAERRMPLDALDDDAALALMDRVARRRGAASPLDGGDRDALLDVVHLLDGLPLALELAAARLALLSPVQLRERLRASPDVLQDAGADRPDRQRSLRATVEWTVGQLEDGPRALFLRMGAFAGPVELEDLEAIAGRDGLDVLEALAGLLDVALARRVESGDGRVRFGLPEAVRQIAAGRLDADPDGHRWRRAHALHQKDIAWAARMLMLAEGADHRAAVAADAEAAAALHWARSEHDPLAARLGAARGALLAFAGRLGEGAALLRPLLETPSGDALADAHALLAHTAFFRAEDRPDEALASLDRVLTIADDPLLRVMTSLEISLVHLDSDAFEAAVRHAQRASALARDLGPAARGGAIGFEAQARLFAGQLDEAARLEAESQRIGASVDAVIVQGRETFLGDLALLSGRPRDALGHYARSLERAQARGDQLQALNDTTCLAHALGDLGDDAGALEVAGIADAMAADMHGAETAPLPRFPGREGPFAAERRAGPAAAAELRARGRAVPAGARVARACRIARERQAAPAAGG